MTRRCDEIDGGGEGLQNFLDTRKGGFENLYTSESTGGGAPKKLNR